DLRGGRGGGRGRVRRRAGRLGGRRRGGCVGRGGARGPRRPPPGERGGGAVRREELRERQAKGAATEDELRALLGPGPRSAAELPLAIIGSRSRRVDGIAKATGRAVYTDDISLPGMLHGKIRSEEHTSELQSREK